MTMTFNLPSPPYNLHPTDALFISIAQALIDIMLARLLAGEIQLSTTNPAAFCGANTSVSFVPLDTFDGNDDSKEPRPALETGYIILVVGTGIAAAVLLVVAIVKRKLIASTITRAGRHGAGQPKGQSVGLNAPVRCCRYLNPLTHSWKTPPPYDRWPRRRGRGDGPCGCCCCSCCLCCWCGGRHYSAGHDRYDAQHLGGQRRCGSCRPSAAAADDGDDHRRLE